MKGLLALPLILSLLVLAAATPASDLQAAITALKAERALKGLQLQISQKKQVVFDFNIGEKNQANESIDSNTMFRIASVSKSFASVAIMQLVEQGKLSLNQTVSSLLGFSFQNPFFPGVEITVEMILTHQSSLIECDPYYSNFLDDTYNAKTGTEVPKIREILVPGGKYFNNCLFSSTHRPGTNFHYVNLNFGLAGTIVEIVSRQRYDDYQRQHILTPLSEGLPETATFNAANIQNPKNLGVIYIGDKGKWVPNYDYYSDGKINQRNLTGYVPGDNGVIYGPQGGLRASVSHLNNYAIMLANGGTTKQGKVILQPSSVAEMLRPRYQYHGSTGGSLSDYHAYGLGLFATTEHKNDQIISHEVVKGHTGAAYGLISAQHFWGEYTLSYIINGALNGYKYGTGTIYEYERLAIYSAVEKFVAATKSATPQLTTN